VQNVSASAAEQCDAKVVVQNTKNRYYVEFCHCLACFLFIVVVFSEIYKI